jgi:predicted enzyme related to lactoylglutathione lyase
LIHSNEEAVMTHGVKTIIVPVRDLAAAKTLYRTVLGVEPYADEPYYVGFRFGDQEIGLDPNGHNHGMTAPVGYCHVDDAAASLSRAVDAGWRTRQDVKDVGGGGLAAIVEDTDGNVLGFLQNHCD